MVFPSRFIKQIPLLAILLVAPFWARPAQAATVPAATCEFVDVSAAVTAAANGDTVLIPDGNCTWTSKLVIRKAITLQGAGCPLDADGRAVSPCRTIIKDNSANGSSPLIQWFCVAGGTHRVTGIEFQNGGRTQFSGQAVVHFGCTNQTNQFIRLDHNVFNHAFPSDGKDLGFNTASGVVDHNTFLESRAMLLFYGLQWNGIGSNGDESWRAPANWGSSEFVFIEDNTFVIDTEGACTDGYGGARFVLRFNKFIGCTTGQHGTDSTGRQRSTRAVEVYKNLYDLTGKSRSWMHENRDGTLLLWGNTGVNLNRGASPAAALVRSYRSISNFAPWGQQDGTNAWDVNDPNNPYDPGGACRAGNGRACTATSGAGLTVTVNGAGWVPNQWAGFIIHKLNCTPANGRPCASPISSNTSTQITFSSAGGEGANLSFATGDTFHLNRVIAGMDQPGRGGGSLLSGALPAVPAGWNNQEDSPSMQWLNSNNGLFNLLMAVGVNCPGCKKDVNYLDYNAALLFDGTIADNRSSLGAGLSALLPLTCTTGSYYWAIDDGDWNTAQAGPDGRLYKCTSPNNWAPFYTPFTYPHPMVGSPSAPVVLEQPINQSVAVGLTATFTVVASGNPAPTYQWRKNGTNLGGATSSVYTTPVTVLGDDGSTYDVVITNAQGSVTSTPATLTVTLVGVAAPTITAQPANQAVTAGQTATFSVIVTGTPPLFFQWRKNGLNIDGATSETYTTPATVVADDGSIYDVLISNVGGAVTSNAATLTVSAAAVAPAITSQPANQSVAIGQTATFSVAATGIPTPTLQWRKNGVNITGATLLAYTTPATVLADNGSTYDVVVTNAAGTVTSNSATLTVIVVPPSITTHPTNQSVPSGQPATFAVVATGNPEPTYQWRKNGINIPGANLATYTTPDTTLADNGSRFDVVVSNSEGSVTSNAATLTVNTVAPIITGQPANRHVAIGQTATFSVVATGSFPLTYQWRKGGVPIPGATQATYTTPATALADSGSVFDVVITNPIGNVTSNFATLTVTETEPITVLLTSPAAGATVSDTVAVTATTSPNVVGVQFMVDGLDLGSEDTTVPYTVFWNTLGVPNGLYLLTAVARDAGGNLASSSTVSVTVSNIAATKTFSVPTNGGVFLETTDAPETLMVVSHAQIQRNTPSPLTSADSVLHAESGIGGITGVAIVGLRINDVLVTETGVPATAPLLSGRISVEIRDVVNTGIALSNPGLQDAEITFYFTDISGVDLRSGSFLLKASHQQSAFLNQAPFDGPSNFFGTFTFYSSVPVGAIALRGFTNERNEFLISTLPVPELGPQSVSDVPYFANGGGWSTQIVLTNTSDAVETGTVQFFSPGSAGQSGSPLTMIVNGLTSTTFSYSISPRSALRLVTQGVSAVPVTGSIRITPSSIDLGNTFGAVTETPAAVAILAFRNAGITVTEGSVSALPAGPTFRIYVESAGTSGIPRSIQSGLVVSNTSPIPASVSLDLTKLDGTSAGVAPVTLNIPARGQVTRSINELFPQLRDFQGIVRLNASQAVSVAAVRTRYNERGDFLITTTPPMNDGIGSSGTLVFPHIVSGMGYKSQIVLFGQPGSGKLFLYSQDGSLRVSGIK